jgi:hypothetical protein
MSQIQTLSGRKDRKNGAPSTRIHRSFVPTRNATTVNPTAAGSEGS